MARRRNLATPGQYQLDFGFEDNELEADNAAVTDDRLFFVSFGSGSSGNSCYLGTSRGGLLVDAGVKDEDVVRTLGENGVSMDKVRGLLLTHDHSDHVRHAYRLLRTFRHMRLYCTNRVMNGLLRRHSISKRIRDFHTPIFKEIPFKVMDFEVTAFEVPHDGSDNMGFSFDYGEKKFVIATDLGEVQPRARHYMSNADYLVMESNYDDDMLRLGRYPEYLKARIRTSTGHMRNEDTAAFLREIAPQGKLKHVFLCHLSQDNNTPQKALKASRDALEGEGLKVGRGTNDLEDRDADLQLSVLPRFDATPWYVLR